jgi:hypothetical protein
MQINKGICMNVGGSSGAPHAAFRGMAISAAGAAPGPVGAAADAPLAGGSQPFARQRDAVARGRRNFVRPMMPPNLLRAAAQSSPGLFAWLGNLHALQAIYPNDSNSAAQRKYGTGSLRYTLAKALCSTVAGEVDRSDVGLELFLEARLLSLGPLLGALDSQRQQRLIASVDQLPSAIVREFMLEGLAKGAEYLNSELGLRFFDLVKRFTDASLQYDAAADIAAQFLRLSPQLQDDVYTYFMDMAHAHFDMNRPPLKPLISQMAGLSPARQRAVVEAVCGVQSPDIKQPLLVTLADQHGCLDPELGAIVTAQVDAMPDAELKAQARTALLQRRSPQRTEVVLAKGMIGAVGDLSDDYRWGPIQHQKTLLLKELLEIPQLSPELDGAVIDAVNSLDSGYKRMLPPRIGPPIVPAGSPTDLLIQVAKALICADFHILYPTPEANILVAVVKACAYLSPELQETLVEHAKNFSDHECRIKIFMALAQQSPHMSPELNQTVREEIHELMALAKDSAQLSDRLRLLTKLVEGVQNMVDG